MLRRFLILFVSLIAAATFGAEAKAERRVALVIGNSDYAHAGTLRNPRNDASDMAETLTRLGFEVTLGLDLDQQKFAKTIDRFGRQLDDASVALLFYAGHGLQVSEKNYLVSTNARLDSEFLVTSEAIELNAIIGLMESKVPTNLVFLDACRNNPLSDRLRQNLAAVKRSANLGRGLARVEPTGRDTLIAFAAAPGQEAADGRDRNSPFTAALLKHLPRPNVEVSVMLKEVAAEVRRITRNEQRPQQLSDMTRTFYFAKAEPATATVSDATPSAAVALTPAPAQLPRTDDRALELAFWNSVEATNNCGSTRAYLQRFPNGTFVGLARLAEQRQCAPERPAAVTSAPVPQSAAEKLANAAVSPAPSPAGGNAAAAGTVVAALPSPAAPGVVAPSAIDGRSQLARNIQLELIRLGCFAGDADGDWSADTRASLARLNKAAKAKLNASGPSTVTLATLQKRKGRTCPMECGRGYQARGNTCVAIKSQPRKPSASERSVERRPARASREYVVEEPAARPSYGSSFGGIGGGIPIGIGFGFRRR